ncbi:MAG: hypothetical protein EOM53_04280 [Alphaproteobacteria bacterium]|nr:hypothetical protein [Alphaproteobacteria bacterium]
MFWNARKLSKTKENIILQRKINPYVPKLTGNFISSIREIILTYTELRACISEKREIYHAHPTTRTPF